MKVETFALVAIVLTILIMAGGMALLLYRVSKEL